MLNTGTFMKNQPPYWTAANHRHRGCETAEDEDILLSLWIWTVVLYIVLLSSNT